MKPRIKYIDAAQPIPGRSARLYVKDHPKLGTGWITTSRVLAIAPGPCIETLNTVYVPYASFNLTFTGSKNVAHA
jgi:hypothetical protein